MSAPLQPDANGPILPMPPGVEVEQIGGEFRIVRRWSRATGAVMLAFALFWDGFLIFWYSMALSMSAPVIFVLFPLIHVAVGVAITYTAVANLLNTTTLSVEQGWLRIAHGPLPWPRPAPIQTWDLQQLYVKQHISRGRRSTSTTYSLNAVMRDGRSRTLVSNLENPEQAQYLEGRLEMQMGLLDAKVVGEARK